MCGIAGFAGNFDLELLMKMNHLLAHRGPDANDHQFIKTNEQYIGLAHNRLAIIDLSDDGKQPMTVSCTHCHHHREQKKFYLIYNGEIYNYKQLRAELSGKGHQFYSQSDSEVLLHLYAEYGLQMLDKINGVFAFAIYDHRETGQMHGMQPGDLFLARDGIGVKPLYYTEVKNGFLFASELKAFLACNDLSREMDLTAIHYYLAYLWCPGQQTALKNVKKVEPGEALIVRNRRLIKSWHYYDYPYEGKLSSQTFKQLTEQLDDHLTQAVQRQLVADVPVGAFLSGGLDSSAIVAMMRKINPTEQIDCYTIGFAEGMASEGNPNDVPYAQAVAKKNNLKLNVLNIQADMIQHLPKMIYHLDEPQADPAPIHVYLIAQAAKQNGIKVLLSGAGGDDIFSGYRRHQALQFNKYYDWIPLTIRKKIADYARRMQEGELSHGMHHPLTRRLSKLFSAMDLSEDRRLANYFLWNTETLRRTLYSQTMAIETHHIDTISPLLKSLQRVNHEKDELNRMLYLESKHFLADHNLNYTDKMSMATGVEVRVPLLDYDLVKFATQIPSRYKQKGKIGKYIFKKTMETYLDKKIIYRPKAGFGAPLRRWLNHELSPLVNELLSESSLSNRGLFDPQKVKALVKNNKENRVDASYTIFSLLCIELWCRQFVDLKTV